MPSDVERRRWNERGAYWDIGELGREQRTEVEHCHAGQVTR